mgnify:FL=1
MVVLSEIVADSIHSLGTDAQVLFEGGKLPVYNHETFLPSCSGTIQ